LEIRILNILKIIKFRILLNRRLPKKLINFGCKEGIEVIFFKNEQKIHKIKKKIIISFEKKKKKKKKKKKF